jgi:phage tail sheath protein FI
MPEYLSPGVYIEEINTGARPIEGVGTAMAAFVGFAPAGPVNEPQLITNWSQYVEKFGVAENGGRKNPHLDGAYLSHSVYGYFLNGGGRCYVTRVGASKPKVKPQPPALQLPAKAPKSSSLLVHPKEEERAGDIEIEIKPPSGDAPPEGGFSMRVRFGTVEEVHENLTLGKGRGLKNAVETINQMSKLVTVVETAASGTLAERTPETGVYTLKAAPLSALEPVKPASFEGCVAERTGIAGLEIAEEVTMVCCPDLMSAYNRRMIDRDGVRAVQAAMIAHCEQLKDRMAILDPLPDLSPDEALKWRKVETNYDSKFAALYYPWITVTGPDGKPMKVPPSGHIAGIYARNDKERGVHKAPANEVVVGALEAASKITKGEQDLLNPEGVNCIRVFSGRGIRVWGARTLSSDPQWRYVNVRRLFNFVEKSIERGTQWVVFEPNDPDLWARVRRDVGAFLTTVWRDGGLFGLTAAEAFFVKCDEEVNPSEVRDQGKLIIEIGMAPVKPAEFVIFRLSQFAGGGA